MLPFENLTSDAGLDWIAGAVPEVVAWQLTTAGKVAALRAASTREALDAKATRIVHGYLARGGNGIELRTAVEDPATGKNVSAFEVTAAGVLPAAAEISRRLGPAASGYATANEQALKAFVDARRAPDATSAAGLLELATKLAPDYGPAWAARAEMDAAKGPAALVATVGAALAHGQGMAALDRARLEYMAASATGDRAAALRALERMSRELPGDSEVLRALAENQWLGRQYSAASASLGKLLESTPGDISLLNMLGYCQAMAGNLTAAREAFDKYAAIAPGEVNPLDSLGEAYYLNGRFAEAEQAFLKGFDKNPAFFNGIEMMKAAHARLMTGDLEGADRLFSQYLAYLHKAGDPMTVVLEIQWKHMTGRREPAVKAAKLLAGSADNPERAAAAAVQLALWNLEEGKRAEARQFAEAALRGARGVPTRAGAALLYFMTMPAAGAAEWNSRADKFYSGGTPAALKLQAVGFGLLASRRYAEAAAVWDRARLASEPVHAGYWQFFEAWSLLETGRAEEARKLLGTYPVPPSSAEPVALPMTLPRLFDVRARAGAGDAARDAALFRKYSGEK